MTDYNSVLALSKFTDMSATPDVSFKEAINGQISIDEAEGIVDAFVSGVGNKDSVGDIVMPGAFDASLHRRKPRVVWGHDWNHPIGKVLEIEEVPPSDPRLPAHMRAAGIGGLYVKVQFNLTTERGREAFNSVAFYGEDQQWSIGYKTIRSDYDAKEKANLLHEVELFEVSPVLHGANSLTGTVAVKSDEHVEIDEKNQSMHQIPDSLGTRLSRLVSSAINSPVRIVHMDDSTVVVTTPDDTIYAVPFQSSPEGHLSVGSPSKVTTSVSVNYAPVEVDRNVDTKTPTAEKSLVESLVDKYNDLLLVNGAQEERAAIKNAITVLASIENKGQEGAEK